MARRGSTVGVRLAVLLAVGGTTACGGAPLSDTSTYTLTLESGLENNAASFCPGTLLGAEGTPVANTTGTSFALSLDAEDDIHTMTPNEPGDPLASLFGAAFSFDIGPIGSIYTSETSAASTLFPAGGAVTSESPWTRTFIGGSRKSDTSVELTFGYTLGGDTFTVQKFSDQSELSCEPESVTLTWSLVGG